MKKSLIVTLIFMNLMVNPVWAMEYVNTDNLNGCNTVQSEESFENQSKTIIKRMENTLLSMKKSPDINMNFLNQMIGLHSEEIQLSIAIQQYTNNPQVIQFANTLLAAENGELREMRIIRKELTKDMGKNTKENDDYMNSYNNLIKKRFITLAGYKVTGNPEKDYLNIMKINNEEDIELANDYLKYSNNDIIKKIAGNIITVKKNQINDADKILSALK